MLVDALQTMYKLFKKEKLDLEVCVETKEKKTLKNTFQVKKKKTNTNTTVFILFFLTKQ